MIPYLSSHRDSFSCYADISYSSKSRSYSLTLIFLKQTPRSSYSFQCFMFFTELYVPHTSLYFSQSFMFILELHVHHRGSHFSQSFIFLNDLYILHRALYSLQSALSVTSTIHNTRAPLPSADKLGSQKCRRQIRERKK